MAAPPMYVTLDLGRRTSLYDINNEGVTAGETKQYRGQLRFPKSWRDNLRI